MLGMQLDPYCNRCALQIKNVNGKNKGGDCQVLLSLMALTYYYCQREPMIGAIVHPLRVCFVYLDFMTF